MRRKLLVEETGSVHDEMGRTRIYLGLGSNMDDRLGILRRAVDALDNHHRIEMTKVSQVYETEPVGGVEQPPFLNLVAEGKTSLPPEELLDACQKIERDFDRRRDVRWGPRTLDIDILIVGDQTIDTKRLIVPHPEMHRRAFVLIPLSELGYDGRVRGKPIKHWLDEVKGVEGQGVVPFEKTTGWLHPGSDHTL